MIVTPIKTTVIKPNQLSLIELLDNHLKDLSEGCVLAITSKIVSLCEGRVVPIEDADKEELIKQEASYYLPSTFSNYGYHFTITGNTIIAAAGIDESNGGNNYILWPEDPQATANTIRAYLKNRFNITKVGVVITDSTSTPLRRGAIGTALAHSGFDALNDYIGKPDLFNRPFSFSQANVAGGLAATAVLAMGEGTEQTPLTVISDLPLINFVDHDPTPEELTILYPTKDDDLYAPFLNSANWIKSQKAT